MELKSLLFGEVVENRLWFQTRFDPISPLLVDALALGVGDWYASRIVPLLSQDLQFYNSAATDWTAFPSPYAKQEIYAVSGGVAEGSHSANVSIRALFKGTSDQTFPSNSNFIPAIPLSAVNGNYYTPEIRDALFEAYVSLIDDAPFFGPGHNWRWVITSRVVDHTYRTEQLASRVDFIRFPSPTISPRRRRLPRP